nr:MAG TPA: hypothetical protein [Caudoviricetes sp.]
MALTKKQIEARQVFAKYCVKTGYPVVYAGAQRLSNDGKQYVGNAYWIARYTEHIDGLETAGMNCDYSKYIDEAATAWKYRSAWTISRCVTTTSSAPSAALCTISIRLKRYSIRSKSRTKSESSKAAAIWAVA